MIHITKIHKQRKSTTEPAVRRRPCSRRPTAAGVRPLRLATRCGSGSSGPSPRRSGRLLLPVWSSLGGLRLLAGPRLLLPVWTTAAGLHPSKAARPPACTRPRNIDTYISRFNHRKQETLIIYLKNNLCKGVSSVIFMQVNSN